MKAAGDPLRLQLLRLLKSDVYGVLELSQLLGIQQSRMSHHLKVLSAVGLVETQREGNSIFYRRPLLAASEGEDPRAALFEIIDLSAIPVEISDRLASIRDQRAAQSRAFFDRHGNEFEHQQEKVASFEIYSEAVLRLIRTLQFPADADVLEIGPGDGAFLEVLLRHFTQVSALDNSPQMLARTRERLGKQSRAQLICGDTSQGAAMGRQFDLLVMNMVLHHVASPASVLDDCARLLKPGGSLIVADLAHHDQQWTREACGDLWLGFSGKDLDAWSRSAGLNAADQLILGVRNGFQVQVRHYRRPGHRFPAETKATQVGHSPPFTSLTERENLETATTSTHP